MFVLLPIIAVLSLERRRLSIKHARRDKVTASAFPAAVGGVLLLIRFG